MEEKLQSLLTQAQHALDTANDLTTLESLKVQYLGKKGEITELLKQISQWPVADRPRMGQMVNAVKEQLQSLIQSKQEHLQSAELNARLYAEAIDITLPGRRCEAVGSLHPVTLVRQRVEALFHSIGFEVNEGPEIEDEYHNFEALNIPAHHPARAMHDTFYCEHDLLLRTHTSNAQIRVMKTQKPPIRIITPGRVYRCDSDRTHTPMFHQVEGLVVDSHSTFADLKGLLQNFISEFFEQSLKFRLRPSYFPFTEPSAEMDISCVNCEGQGCRICKETGWLEILGCGMIHPNVLKNVGIDPERYSGYAFGMGLDRLAMLRYRISDLRLLFENDIRFLSEFV
ncbi:MAG TPA: phenylalanine--tRNA ligase subunit alpha [Coxiellaceae bacterium]|nr:phenylalanine--tRNA ligase subunit alpha [Coxiellaceae bacterium]